MRKTLSAKTSLQGIIPLVCGTSAAMMLDQGFSIHHEARDPSPEGYGARRALGRRAKDTKNGQPD
jgi:hypothetical protein